ncbi:DUF1538 domain-containing protein [Sutcliffiella deserti]|uniref:DUF1538 domain-containing protein n=1 Tax=Sutcliffiella deserti TaxID=2875501 RepID=UPI001CBD855C|nr:DUF1538 domain-containing protein [Sutcliffiella deserti]
MMDAVLKGFGDVLLEVALALIPLLVFFLIFQFIFLKLDWAKIKKIFLGFILSYIGLALFLQGVHIGFMPIGEKMGETLGNLSFKWIIIPIGFVLGFVATFAEPAVRVLNKEVEDVTKGYLTKKTMLYTLSLGVGVAIALSMLRIQLNFSIWYYIIPGYLLAFILIFFTKKQFVSIAFDSGGVATGPMTVTFIVSMAVGIAAVTEGSDPLTDGFGMIALVALAPIISVLILGIIYKQEVEE